MLKKFAKRAGLAAAVCTLLAASAAPVFANQGPSSGDPTGDPTDPITAQSDLQRGDCAFGVSTSPCGNPAGTDLGYKATGYNPLLDLTGYSVSSTNVGGTPALSVSMSVATDLPTGITAPQAGTTGVSFYLMFQTQEIQDNNYHPYCARASHLRSGTDLGDSLLAPVYGVTDIVGDPAVAAVNGVRGGSINRYYGHKDDDHYFFVDVNYAFDGTTWDAKPEAGEYLPAYDANEGIGTAAIPGFAFFNLGTTPGTSASVNGNTINFTIPTVFQQHNVNCEGNDGTVTLANFGQHISNVTAMIWADQTVELPVTVPLSIVTGNSTDDINSAGGFIALTDWSDNSWDYGLFGSFPNPDRFVGLGCPVPGLGSLTPQPVWNPGQACMIANPLGAHFIPNNRNFTF